MLYIGVSAFTTNSAAFVYNRAGALSLYITDDMVSFSTSWLPSESTRMTSRWSFWVGQTDSKRLPYPTQHQNIWSLHPTGDSTDFMSTALSGNLSAKSLCAFRLPSASLVWWWNCCLKQWKILRSLLNQTTWRLRPLARWQLTPSSPTSHLPLSSS